jgi:hypothetical protein
MSELSLAHARCRICERPLLDCRLDDSACEVCGIYLHFTCWLELAATPAERRQFTTATSDDDVKGLVIRCRGCQS